MTHRLRPALHALLVTLIALGAMGGLRTHAPSAPAGAPGAERTRLDAWRPASPPTFLAASGAQLPAAADAADRSGARQLARPTAQASRTDAHGAQRSRLCIGLAATAYAACARSLARARIGPPETRGTPPPAIS